MCGGGGTLRARACVRKEEGARKDAGGARRWMRADAGNPREFARCESEQISQTRAKERELQDDIGKGYREREGENERARETRAWRACKRRTHREKEQRERAGETRAVRERV